MSQAGVSRRNFVGIVAAGAVAGACADDDGGPARPTEQRPRTPQPGDYRESPMLTERVEASELPPIVERLPKEPYVVRPGLLVADEHVKAKIGQHGGRLELAQDSPAGDPTIFIGNNEPLLWAPNGVDFAEGFHGNVVAGFEANDDDTVFTFHLREGLKWSDGEPVIMEDVRFAFEDVLYNEEITPIFPDYLRAGRSAEAAPAELEVVDDWTFSLRFDGPYGPFPSQLSIAGWISYGDIIKPRHYLEQFHQKYAEPNEFAELLEAESIPPDQWFNLFNAKQLTGWLWNVTVEENMGHPTLTPWIMTRASSGVYRYERNPYYFKVDEEGNQLPYIDELRSQVVQDYETMTSRALFGEFDYLGTRASFRQLPLMAEKADAGDVRLFVPRRHTIPLTVFFNFTHSDEVWREVIGDVRFRRALSLATNREEVIENFYLGEFASLPEETNPPDHDPEEANRLLDEMGLDQKDGDGFRLGPDGNRFRIPFEIAARSEEHIPAGELLAEYWKAVGIDTTVRTIDQVALGENMAANEHKATIVTIAHPLWPSAGWDDYLPKTNWAPLWHEWYLSQGESGEEPPDEVKQLYDLHETFMSTRLESEESNSALAGILQSYFDNVWVLNLVEHAYWPDIFTSRVRNTPEGVKLESLGQVGRYSMEQWYIED